jgi:hypothetical protein
MCFYVELNDQTAAHEDTMAKDKTKKPGGKAKKGSDDKLPKAFRKIGQVKELVNSELGREILADALIAAATAAAAALTAHRTGKGQTDMRSIARNATRDVVNTAAGAVAGVVTDAARHFLPASLIEGEEGEAGGSQQRPPAKRGVKKAAKKPATSPIAAKKRRAPRKGAAKAPAMSDTDIDKAETPQANDDAE